MLFTYVSANAQIPAIRLIYSNAGSYRYVRYSHCKNETASMIRIHEHPNSESNCQIPNEKKQLACTSTDEKNWRRGCEKNGIIIIRLKKKLNGQSQTAERKPREGLKGRAGSKTGLSHFDFSCRRTRFFSSVPLSTSRAFQSAPDLPPDASVMLLETTARVPVVFKPAIGSSSRLWMC